MNFSKVTRQTITDPRDIILVDDIITRGTTFLSAYYKIRSAFPDSDIGAFAAMRTILLPGDSFKDALDPYVGDIRQTIHMP